jgi:hypothetical protein
MCGIRLKDGVSEQLGKILKLSSDVLYFDAKRVPPDVRRDATDSEVKACLQRLSASDR